MKENGKLKLAFSEMVDLDLEFWNIFFKIVFE